MNKVIIFEKSVKKEILDLFDKTIDNEGFIVEKDNPIEKVITPDGEELELENFAGIRKGSEIFIKSDLNSLISLADTLY